MRYNYYVCQFNQDEAAHKTYAYAMDARNFVDDRATICRHCGREMQVYYCQERLYMVRCLYCKTVALTTAGNPPEAIKKTAGKYTQKQKIGGGEDEKA